MKKAMQQLNIANKMLKESIDERDHGIIEGYTDLEITNVRSTPRGKTVTAVVTLMTGTSSIP